MNNTRERIMEAARELAEERRAIQGVTISLESVAKRAGVTKPGLMYHYGSKRDLMMAVVEYSTRRWDALLRSSAGGPAEACDAFERHRAYVRVATDSQLTRADYWINADARYLPELSEAWTVNLAPWLNTAALSAPVVALLDTARFAADGVWAAAATGVLPPADMDQVRTRILRLIDEAEVLS